MNIENNDLDFIHALLNSNFESFVYFVKEQKLTCELDLKSTHNRHCRFLKKVKNIMVISVLVGISAVF